MIRHRARKQVLLRFSLEGAPVFLFDMGSLGTNFIALERDVVLIPL